MGGDDHLLGSVGAMLQMCSSLRPTRMTCMYFEPASIKRDEVVHLMQFVDLNTELFRQVEIVRRHLVLGVVAAADLAVAASNASGAPGSEPAEVWVFGFDARTTLGVIAHDFSDGLNTEVLEGIEQGVAVVVGESRSNGGSGGTENPFAPKMFGGKKQQ